MISYNDYKKPEEFINNLNENNYLVFKEAVFKQLPFHTEKATKSDNFDRMFIEEKIFDFIECCMLNENIKSINDIDKAYVGELFPLINISFGRNSNRLDRYFDKAKKLKKKIEANKSISYDDLAEFTRIFMCIYGPCSRAKKKLEDDDFSFDVDTDIYKVISAALVSNSRYKKEKFSKFQLSTILFDIIGIYIIDKTEKGEC